jgi:hypothetical protein
MNQHYLARGKTVIVNLIKNHETRYYSMDVEQVDQFGISGEASRATEDSSTFIYIPWSSVLSVEVA